MKKTFLILSCLLAITLLSSTASASSDKAIVTNDFFNEYTFPFYDGYSQYMIYGNITPSYNLVQTYPNGTYALTSQFNPNMGTYNHLYTQFTVYNNTDVYGSINMSDGTTIFYTVQYVDNIINKNLKCSLLGPDGSVDFTDGYLFDFSGSAQCTIDVCINTATGKQYVAIVYGGLDEWRSMGHGTDSTADNVKACLYEINNNTFIKDITITHESGSYNAKIYEFTTQQLGYGIYRVYHPNLTDYPTISSIDQGLGVLGVIAAQVWGLILILKFVFVDYWYLTVALFESFAMVKALDKKNIIDSVVAFVGYNVSAVMFLVNAFTFIIDVIASTIKTLIPWK